MLKEIFCCTSLTSRIQEDTMTMPGKEFCYSKNNTAQLNNPGPKTTAGLRHGVHFLIVATREA
jgi:hypothetical protein